MVRFARDCRHPRALAYAGASSSAADETVRARRLQPSPIVARSGPCGYTCSAQICAPGLGRIVRLATCGKDGEKARKMQGKRAKNLPSQFSPLSPIFPSVVASLWAPPRCRFCAAAGSPLFRNSREFSLCALDNLRAEPPVSSRMFPAGRPISWRALPADGLSPLSPGLTTTMILYL